MCPERGQNGKPTGPLWSQDEKKNTVVLDLYFYLVGSRAPPPLQPRSKISFCGRRRSFFFPGARDVRKKPQSVFFPHLDSPQRPERLFFLFYHIYTCVPGNNSINVYSWYTRMRTGGGLRCTAVPDTQDTTHTSWDKKSDLSCSKTAVNGGAHNTTHRSAFFASTRGGTNQRGCSPEGVCCV